MWFNQMIPCIGNVGKLSKTRLAKYENNLEWQNTFINLMNIGTNLFRWNGLPETCNERFLELALITNGTACMVNDPERGLLTLFANPYYNINIYGEFTRLRGVGWNGFNKDYTAWLEGADNSNAEAVLCRDNNMMYPYLLYIIRATDRLTSAMRSIDVASKKLKNPYFISCDESQYLSVKKILDDVDSNQEAIISSKSTYAEMFKVFPTSVDINVLTILWQHYNNLDNQIRTIMGIQNNDRSAKQERLLVDEVNANNVITDLNINMRLRQRELFAERCNSVFGTNMSAEINLDFIQDTFTDTGNEVGGDENDESANDSATSD